SPARHDLRAGGNVGTGTEGRIRGVTGELVSGRTIVATSSALVIYVSGHGFGHAARSIEVINAILARRPETRIGVRTAAPRWLFDLTIKGKITFSTLETDTGVVQIDALTLDEADSIRRASAFHS